MLQYENELRLSQEWLQKMEKEISQSNDDSPSALDGYMTDKISPTINELQLTVVRKFGYNDSMSQSDEAVKILRSALATYPGDKEIKEAANYLKYNRINKGTFKVGEKANVEGINVLEMGLNTNKNNDDKDNAKNEEKKQENEDAEYSQKSLSSILSAEDINVLIGVSVT